MQTRGHPIVHHLYVCFTFGDIEVLDQIGDFPGVNVTALLHLNCFFPNKFPILGGLGRNLFTEEVASA